MPTALSLTSSQFKQEISFRLQERGQMKPDDASNLAEVSYGEMLKTLGVEFGHPDFAWDKDAAHEWADTELG